MEKELKKELKFMHGLQSEYDAVRAAGQIEYNTLYFTEEKDTWKEGEEKRGRIYHGYQLVGMGLPMPFGPDDSVLTIIEDPDTHAKDIAWKYISNVQMGVVELKAYLWDNHEQTVSFQKVKSTHHVWDMPVEVYCALYEEHGIRLKSHTDGQLTFECDTDPELEIPVSIIFGGEIH